MSKLARVWEQLSSLKPTKPEPHHRFLHANCFFGGESTGISRLQVTTSSGVVASSCCKQ